MSWELAEGRLLAAKPDTVRLSVREIRWDRRTKGTRNTLIFYIGSKIGREMGLSTSTRVNLFWGSGKNQGWCRIEVAPEGRFCIRQTHRGGVRELAGFYFKTQQHPLEGGVPHRADLCTHVVAPDRALEIKLPDWFWRASQPTSSTTSSTAKGEKPKQNGAFSQASGD